MKCLDLLLKKWVEVHDQSGDANDTFIDNAEDLDVVMPMYNLLEYSKNYSKTTGSFWNYYRDEPNSGVNNNINYSIKDSKSFNYKASITEN